MINVKVHGAQFIEDLDCIAVLLYDDEGKELKHIMYGKDFYFSPDMDRLEEMTKLAELMVGKRISYCIEDDFEDKKKELITSIVKSNANKDKEKA